MRRRRSSEVPGDRHRHAPPRNRP